MEPGDLDKALDKVLGPLPKGMAEIFAADAKLQWPGEEIKNRLIADKKLGDALTITGAEAAFAMALNLYDGLKRNVGRNVAGKEVRTEGVDKKIDGVQVAQSRLKEIYVKYGIITAEEDPDLRIKEITASIRKQQNNVIQDRK